MNFSTNQLRRNLKKKRNISIKARQDSFDDILHLISNIITQEKCWTTCNINSLRPSTVAVSFFDLTNEFFLSDCRSYNNKSSTTHKYISYTLILYIFIMFSISVTNSKSPILIRILKENDTIDTKECEVLDFLTKELLQQLKLVLHQIISSFNQRLSTFFSSQK